MDGNKDDALKCLKIGKEALESGNRERAAKFIAKARRLDPSLPVDDLLSRIEKEPSDESTPHASEPGRPPPNSAKSIHQRSPHGLSSSSSMAYTEEQIAIVREIRKKKDYYEILGLEKTCSVDDVRKAYRKLSLKVHPDKNKAPGAEEAFKAVSKAFQCLSNEESRRNYDVSGSEDPVYLRRATRHAPRAYNVYDADIDAEEIFRQFFFGGMTPSGMGQRHADVGPAGFNLRMLIQLLPVLLVLLLNFLPSSEPVYTLSRRHPYEHKMTTPRGVNYYVKSTDKLDKDYPPDSVKRAQLEHRVEKEYHSILAENCQLEMQRRYWGYIRETPHCNMLWKFEEALEAKA